MYVLLFVGLYSVLKAQDILVIEMNDNTTRIIKTEDIRQMTFQTSSCPVPEAIDLGLPSGTLWASWNVGASAPEEYGGYFAWGETEEKDFYDWSTYSHYDNSCETCYYIGDNISGTEYDVAHVKWGGSWRMPSFEQIQELGDKCTHEWTTQNGVNGTLVTGPNGNTIFLPAAGSHWPSGIADEGMTGWYWLSSLGPQAIQQSFIGPYYWCFSLKDWFGYYYDFRYIGCSVRAVCVEENPQECPVAEAIDLGLPSGTKWASWNIGASAPEEYGGYYAWGETDTKENYTWSNYKYNQGIGDDIAGTEYDVAHVKWGGSWHMPSKEQIEELIGNCSRWWTLKNGVRGILVIGPNGASIFLPAAGSSIPEDSFGSYWSSSLYLDDENFALGFGFNSSIWSQSHSSRCIGQSVRAVCP